MGIGTMTPGQKLDVVGNAAISGSITGGGTLGIGTGSPQARLHVHESTALGGNLGNSQIMERFSGVTGGNTLKHSVWLYRDDSAYSNLWTTRLHDGISIDDSYSTPGSNTLTWWERDPNHDVQSWGSGASPYLTINAGRVGVGITSPTKALTLAHASNGFVAMNTYCPGLESRYLEIGYDYGNSNAIINWNSPDTDDGYSPSARHFEIRRNGTPLLIMRTNGNIGFNTAAHSYYTLDVGGQIRANGGSWTSSDERLKKNIEIASVSGVLDKVKNLNMIKYQLNKDEVKKMKAGVKTLEEYDKKIERDVLSATTDTAKIPALLVERKNAEEESLKYCDDKQIGVSAQELEAQFPELVRTDENGYKAVAYEKLSVVLLQALKEQQQQIDTLKVQIANLDNKKVDK